MSKIRFNNVTHVYLKGTSLERVAISNINLSIEKGSWHTIIGHSGSGKSTLIQHINGLLRATSGDVIIDDYKIKSTNWAQKELLKIRKNNSIVFQFPEIQLFSETIEQEIMFGPINFGVSENEAKKLALKYIKKVGLDESFLNKSPFELSGGEKRRVAIASILSIQPKVLVIDEPTAGLDPIGKKEIMEIFKKLNQEGITIILITHNMDHVWEYSDVITLLNNGKIVFSGKKESLFSDNKFLLENSIWLPQHIDFIKSFTEIFNKKIPLNIVKPSEIISYIKNNKEGK